MTERILRLLTYGALALELHALARQWADRQMDRELKWLCEQATR